MHAHWSTYLMLNERGSTGVNGAAVSTDDELLPRFIISGLFVHASCFDYDSARPAAVSTPLN
jgi:hypothetical protein